MDGFCAGGMEDTVKIVNHALRREMALPGRCEWCSKLCRKREGAHLWGRGAGASDIRCNMISLGSTPMMQCPCHTNSHSVCKPSRSELLAVVAKRERTTPEAIEEVVNFIRYILPKNATVSVIESAMIDLSDEGRKLAQREFLSAGIMT